MEETMNSTFRPWPRLAALALAISVPAAASAQLDAALPEPVIEAVRGTTHTIDVTLQNTTEETLYLLGIASSLSEKYAAADLYDDFVAFGPDSLEAGEGWEGPFLKLTIAPDAPLTVETFEVSLTGGFHEYDELNLATMYFSVDDSSAVVGIPASEAATPALTLRPTRNPSVGTTTFLLGLSAPRPVDVRVFDATGRAVRSLFAGPLPAGEHRLVWDGASDSGQPTASGVYFIRAQSGGLTLKTKVVRIE
jgi:hypothetical protein